MKTEKLKVFVTGGAGFIGSHLVDRLMADDNRVTVFDNLTSGKREFIEHHMAKRDFKLVQADLLELDKVKAAIAGT